MKCPKCSGIFRGTVRMCPHCGLMRQYHESWADANARQRYKRRHRKQSLPLSAMLMLPAAMMAAAVVNAKSKPKYCECCGQKIPEESE